MNYLRQTISSAELSGIFDLPQSLRNKKVEVIILPAETEVAAEISTKEPKHGDIQGFKVNIGFLKGKIPELPDSFFDPLPEEDLQAWGL